MRVVFLGTPSYALAPLQALMDAGHQVAAVFTQPDKPAGRGRLLQASPVKSFAQAQGIPVHTPPSLRQPQVVETLKALKPDAMVIAAYGKLLPPQVLEIPPLGCLNLHPSLLPRGRGPSPVAWAILEGEDITGITLMLLDPGMDTGPILAQRDVSILPQEDTPTLTQRLFHLGAQLLVEVLPAWSRGEIQPKPQDPAQATYSRPLSKGDGKLDWGLSAVALWRKIRAYQPWPGAYTTWKGKALKILEAQPLPQRKGTEPMGQVFRVPLGPAVATGDGMLLLQRLQIEGKKSVSATDFLQGYRDLIGSRLAS